MEVVASLRELSDNLSGVKYQVMKCDICERTFNSENAFEDHVCKQKENVRTPSPVRRVNEEIPLDVLIKMLCPRTTLLKEVLK